MLQVEVVAAPSALLAQFARSALVLAASKLSQAQLHIDSQSLDHAADRSVDFEERYFKQSLPLLGSSAVGWISQVDCGGSLEEFILQTPVHREI